MEVFFKKNIQSLHYFILASHTKPLAWVQQYKTNPLGKKTSDLLAYIMSHLFIFGIYIIFGKFIIPFQVCGLKQKCSITKSTIKSLLNVKSKFLLQHNCKIPFTT